VTTYYNITDIDLERFIRSNYDSAKNIVDGFSSDESIKQMKDEIPNLKDIKV